MKGAGNAAVQPRTFVAHALAAAAAAMVLVWCIHFRGGLAFRSSNKSLIFNVHPVLMLIGVVVIGGEAILSYRSLPLSKQVKKKIHLSLHAIALAAGVVGIYAVFKFHNESGIPNLYTLHSWIGLATICLYGFQWIVGCVAFFFPGVRVESRRSLAPWHAVFGLLVYLLAVGNAQLGLLEKLTFLQQMAGVAKYGPEALLVNFTGVVLVLLGASVLIATFSSDPAKYTAV